MLPNVAFDFQLAFVHAQAGKHAHRLIGAVQIPLGGLPCRYPGIFVHVVPRFPLRKPFWRVPILIAGHAPLGEPAANIYIMRSA